MIDADTFVGSVAMILGVVCLVAAVFNWPWYFEMQKSRWLERMWGRAGARIFFALLGIGLVVLGGAIALGFLRGSA